MTWTPQYVTWGRVTRVKPSARCGVLRTVVVGEANANLSVAPHGEAGAVKRVGTRGTPYVGTTKA